MNSYGAVAIHSTKPNISSGNFVNRGYWLKKSICFPYLNYLDWRTSAAYKSWSVLFQIGSYPAALKLNHDTARGVNE